ncbi:hypothetical protein IW140_003722 [Coemansia sp. RSA 1813]|nr:hypothetical protein EV178_003687 [Coemansia sp. RSA 1646]KAJ1768881.1 hypothetical protein LPJ74_004525 [Coemansia sp. RSA 1843]KAJ2088726.1 hypothetical protein IW138_003998 [Coemansia sp. RSA 986]KAJ2213655.1 hypothetical protein EV179_003655 [Coemansia sp. RSA 487]KAJ2568628.1 hypothetical protein IW140_003722 [Coemansia sp. RSA 1813]
MIQNLRARAVLYADVWRAKFGQAKEVLALGVRGASRAVQLPVEGKAFFMDSVRFFMHNPTSLKNEILSGVSISLMQVPESVAFAFVANISPVKGMFSTFFIGLVGGFITTMPGMVSGIAGGMVAIQKDLTSDSGPLGDMCMVDRVEWLYATTLICGIIQVLIGVFGIAKFLKLVPHAVMVGFMNGLAIVIFRAQLTAFQTDKDGSQQQQQQQTVNGNVCPLPDYEPPKDQRWLRLNEGQTWQVLAIVFISMAIMILQTKIKRRLRIWKLSISANIIPSSLTAMIVCTLITKLIYEKAAGKPIRSIGDRATFPGNVPMGHIPDVPWSEGRFWGIIMEKAVLLAVVGLVETAMTWRLCQKIIGENIPSHYCNADFLGQGFGNILSSFFTSVGGSVMVGQTTVNLLNGSRSRLSTFVASFLILLYVAVAGKVIEMIPVAALTGILFVVVVKTFEWRTLVYILRWSIPLTDIITIVLVTVLAVVTDLAIAVLIGIAWSAVSVAWKMASDTRVDEVKKLDVQGVSVVKISGPLFFGSAADVSMFFNDTERFHQSVIVLDMSDASVYDSSGVEILKRLVAEVCSNSDSKEQKVVIKGLDEKSAVLVTKSLKLANAASTSESAMETPNDMHSTDIEISANELLLEEQHEKADIRSIVDDAHKHH